jgi:hypothetical protein
MHDEELLVVQDHPDVRRARSGAIINVDTAAYENYIKIRENRRQQRERVESMENRINNMEADIADIKTLLIRMLEK